MVAGQQSNTNKPTPSKNAIGKPAGIPKPGVMPVRSLLELTEEAEALKQRLADKNKLCTI